MAANTIATLMAVIKADTSDFSRGIKSASDDLSFLEKGTKGVADTMGGLLKAGAMAGAAAIGGLAAGFGKAVSLGAELEQGAANISATFGKMAPKVEEVQELINTLSLDPKLTIGMGDAAEMLDMLAKNGLEWSDIAGGAARSTTLLANATGADYATAADIATNAMSIFGKTASELDGVVAGVVNTVNASQFSVDDYGYALANAGPKAAMLGVDLEELNVLLSMTAGNFSSGMQAGTSFSWMFSNMVPNTDKAKDAMKELGIVTAEGTNRFFDATGTFAGTDNAIKVLKDSFGKLSTEQQLAYSRVIFGGEAFGALSATLALNTDEFKKNVATVNDFSAVEGGAATRTNTFKAALALVGDTITSVGAMIGMKFLPIFADLARSLAEFIKIHAPGVIEWAGHMAEKFTVVISWVSEWIKTGDMLNEKLAELPAPIQTVVRGVEAFIKTVTALFRPVTDAIGTVVNWKDALIALGILGLNALYPILAGFAAAIAPVIAQIAAATAIVALLRKAWENDWGGIRTDITNTWNYLNEVFADAYDVIRRFGGESLREIVAWASGQKTNFEATKQLWQSVKDAFGRMWDDMMAHLRTTNPEFAHQLSQIRDSVGRAFQKAAEFLGIWRGDWDSTFKYITSSAFMFAFMEWIRDIPLRLELMVKDAIRAFNNWKLDMQTKWQDLLGIAQHWWGSLVDWVLGKTQWWGGEMEKKVDAVYWVLHGIWVRIRNETMIIWQAVLDWILPKWQKLIDWWQPAEWIKKATDVVQGFWNGIKERWTAFTSWWSGKWEDLKTGFKNFFGIRSPSTVFAEFGENIGAGLQGGLESSIPGVQGVMDDLADTVTAPSLISEFASAGSALGSTFGNSISSSMATALDKAKQALADLKTGLGNIGSSGGGSGGTGGGGSSGGFASGLGIGAITDFLASRASDLYDTAALNQVDKSFKQATIALGNSIQRLDAAGMSDANLTKQLSSISKLLTGVADTGTINGSLWSEIDSTLKTELNYLITTIKAMRNAMGGGEPSAPTTPTGSTDPHVNDGGHGGGGTQVVDDGPAHSSPASWDISRAISTLTSAGLNDAFDWITDFADAVQGAFGGSGMTSIGYNAIRTLQSLEPEDSYSIGPDGQIQEDHIFTKARTDSVVSAIYALIEELKGRGLGNQFNVSYVGPQGETGQSLQNVITYLYQLYG